MRPIGLCALALVACKPEKNTGDTGADLSCSEDVTQLSVEQDSPLGFAARDINTLTSGDHDATLTWAQGGTTGLRVRATYADGDIRYIERALEGGGDAELTDTAGADELCPDTLEIDIDLTLETDDGALDEKWAATLVATAADSAAFSYTFDPLDLNGTYDVATDLDVTDYDTLEGVAAGTIDLSGTTGTLSGQASGQEDCPEGDECSAWSSRFEIGSWVPAS